MFDKYLKNLTSLEEDEEIKGIVRHHWISFSMAFLKIIIPPILILILIRFMGFSGFIKMISGFIMSWVFFAVFIFWATFSFYNWFIWYFDSAVITNKRVIIIEQSGVFNKTVSSADFEKIQDITVQISGLIPTLFGYGNIILQTAGEAPNLTMKDVPKPGDIQQKILHIKNIAREPEENKKTDE